MMAPVSTGYVRIRVDPRETRVVKSFLLGRTLDRIALMIVTTIPIVAFAI